MTNPYIRLKYIGMKSNDYQCYRTYQGLVFNYM